MVPLHDPIDSSVRTALAAYDDLTAALLARRGITTNEEAEAFLAPSYDAHIHNPLLMTDMPKASERLMRAIDARERIAVWSDYDCDGIPGGALFHDFLKKAGAHFTNYVPHRHNEGYGLNTAGIDLLAAEGATLLITIDSGITDAEAVAYATEKGMDVIVTDHHLPADGLPPAFAVLNPNAREDETYPYKGLCGAGVAWKLVCATLAQARATSGHRVWDIPEGWEKWLLDMAGMATIADMVPLTGENRVIAAYGLLVMRKSPRPGFVQLCKVARTEQRSLTEDDIGFMLAPRVNAASRMGNPRDALRLLTTQEQAEAEQLAKQLEALNRSRKASAAAITRAVNDRLLERKVAGTLPPVIALGDPDWRPGLLGLVANGVAEEYGRPVFLWGREGSGENKGSCRGGPTGVHVVSLMQAAGDTFVGFGGHKASGGFSVAPHAVHDFEERLAEALATLNHTEDAEEERADMALSPEDITRELLTRMKRLAPFGMGNPRPLIALMDAPITKVSWFGKGDEHIRVHIRRGHEAFPDEPLEAMCFYARRSLGEVCDRLSDKQTAHLLATIEEDTFTKGRPVRLRIVSIR